MQEYELYRSPDSNRRVFMPIYIALKEESAICFGFWYFLGDNHVIIPLSEETIEVNYFDVEKWKPYNVYW